MTGNRGIVGSTDKEAVRSTPPLVRCNGNGITCTHQMMVSCQLTTWTARSIPNDSNGAKAKLLITLVS